MLMLRLPLSHTSNNRRKVQLVADIDRKSNEGCIADCRHCVITRCSALQASLFKNTVEQHVQQDGCIFVRSGNQASLG